VPFVSFAGQLGQLSPPVFCSCPGGSGDRIATGLGSVPGVEQVRVSIACSQWHTRRSHILGSACPERRLQWQPPGL